MAKDLSSSPRQLEEFTVMHPDGINKVQIDNLIAPVDHSSVCPIRLRRSRIEFKRR